MPDQSQPATPSQRTRRGSHVLSTILFVAAIGFAAAAVYLWYYDDSDNDPVDNLPSSETGVNGLVDVLNGFQAAGLDADYGRTPPTASSNQIDRPGQNLRVGDTNVYVFLYPGADAASATAAREADADKLDADTMTLTTPSGMDVADGEPLTVFQGGNVVAVLVGGDEDLQATIRTVIEGLN